MAIQQNGLLTATGVVYEVNTKALQALDLYVDDNGGGSTITVESSTDDASWGNLTTIYKFVSGNPVANGGATLTAKGRYWIDVSAVSFVRIRVSTYVSGNVITRVEESTQTFRNVISMLVTGLVAQGTTQAGAWPIQAVFNQFATVAASSGAILPSNVSKNSEIVVKNSGANSLAVYPPLAGTINGGSANASVAVAAAASARFISDGAGNFWQF
jgi:hypothetical protein